MYIRVLLIILIPQLALALDITSKGLYRATKEACGQVTAADLSNLNADKLRAGYFPSKEFNEIINFVKRESAKGAALNLNLRQHQLVTYILSEEKFHQALNECYPNDKKMQDYFVESIHRADHSGKMVGVAGLIAVFKGTGKVASLISGWSSKAGTLLKALNNSMNTVLLATLLTKDSRNYESDSKLTLKTSDLEAQVEQETKKLQEMLDSLKEQIMAEEKKIYACGQCPELKKHRANKEMLMQILESATSLQETK